METIEVFAICYNEELLLPYFIDHYKKMGAKITIYDNQSTDRSRSIIEQSGCNYIAYDSNNQIRDDLYLQIKNNCWKQSKADWVIVCDIDELIEVNFDISKYTIINTKGFDMIGLPPSRLGVHNQMYSKHIMFRPNCFKEINYKPGCHSLNPIPLVPISGSIEIANLLHHKYINEDYVYNRHIMYQERLSDINKQLGWGIEYQNVERKKIDYKFKSLRSQCRMILS